jgi:signal transduction histidine kinase
MTLQFERKFTLILLFVFLILTLVGFSFYQSTVSIKQAVVWEKRHQDTLSALDGIMNVTLEADAGVDSFVLNGDSSYLDPYNNAKQRLGRRFAALNAVEDKTDVANAEIERLRTLADKHFERLANIVALRKSAGYDVAVLELGGTADRAVVNDMRATIQRAKDAETARLQWREQQLDNSLSNTITILIASSIAGLTSLAFANFVVFRETAKRSTAEKALVQANRELEQRIDERTSELQNANTELQRAAEERGELLDKEHKARREAEIANRLRDEFMATISHELRTPLNSILGWARLMRGKLTSQQTEKAIETIIMNAELQNRLIEDLLDVARIISGKLELDLQDIDVAEIVKRSIDTMKPAADAKKITIRLLGSEVPVRVVISGDRNRIEQIVLNLLTNATKFSPAGSSISVRVDVNGDDVELSVLDQGVGIKPEFLPMVFERFQQDASTSARSGGLGLGLAIVRNLVELHGGAVSVKSEGEDRGSKFVVRLPLKAVRSAEVSAATS